MSAQWKWVIGIVSIIVVFALLACGIFFAWRYLFAGKPSVVIAAPPSNYQAVEGDEVTVEARATGRSIVRVELWVDGGLMDTASSPSPQDTFSAALTWQATGLGQHIVEVKAHTLAGRESDPASSIIIVIPAEVAEVTTTATVEPSVETPTSTTPPPTATPTSPPGATPTPTSPPPTATPTLAPPVIDSYTIDDSTITDGDTTYLRWEFHNATESHLYRDGVEIESGLVSPGDRAVNPHVTRTFKLVVSNAAGSAEASVTLTVTPAVTPAPVIHYFKANGVEGDISISAGDSVTLEWDTDNAWGGVRLNGVGVVSPGSKVETPGSTTTYTLEADNGAGDVVSLSRTVTVIPAAGPYTQYVTQQVNVGAGATGATIATCPSTAIVVGGGYAADSAVAFYTQYKYGNGWRGDAKNNSGSSKQITVFAVCLHNASGASVTQVHGQVDVPPGNKGQAVATCPAGSIATGGGFHAYPDGSLRVYNSSKADSGQGWQSWASNLSGSTKTHHAYAICLSGTGGSTARILQSADIPAASTGYAIPTCGSGTLVTGGGFAAQEDLIIYSSSGPYSDDEWRVYVRNTHASDDRTLFGYAICLSLP